MPVKPAAASATGIHHSGFDRTTPSVHRDSPYALTENGIASRALMHSGTNRNAAPNCRRLMGLDRQDTVRATPRSFVPRHRRFDSQATLDGWGWRITRQTTFGKCL